MTKICRQLPRNFKIYFFSQNYFSLKIFQILYYLPPSWTGSHSFISLLSTLTRCTSPPILVARPHFPQYRSPLLNEKMSNSKHIAWCFLLLIFIFILFGNKKESHQQKATSCRGSKVFRCEGHWFKHFFWLGMCSSRGFLVLDFVNQGPSLTSQLLDILCNWKIKNVTNISSFWPKANYRK